MGQSSCRFSLSLTVLEITLELASLENKDVPVLKFPRMQTYQEYSFQRRSFLIPRIVTYCLVTLFIITFRFVIQSLTITTKALFTILILRVLFD